MTFFHSNDMTYLPTVEKLCAERRSALDNGNLSLADAIGRRLHLLMLIHTAKKKADKQHKIELLMLERNPAKQLKPKPNQTMHQAAILRIADIVSSNLKLALKNTLELARSLTLSRLLDKCTTNQIRLNSGAINRILFSHFARDNTSQIDSYSLLNRLQLSSERQKIPVH